MWCSQKTYSRRNLDTNPISNKPQNSSTNRNTKPEARCGHSTSKRLAFPDVNHEEHDPASESYLNTNVEEQKGGGRPRDSRCWAMEKGLYESGLFLDLVVVVNTAVGCAVELPEGRCQCA